MFPRVVALLFLSVLLTACGGVKSKKVSEANNSEVRAEIAKLPSDEQDALMTYILMRKKDGTPDVSIGDAIDKGKEFAKMKGDTEAAGRRAAAMIK